MRKPAAHMLRLAALGSVVLPTVALAQDVGETAIEARDGFMHVVVWEAGPLFGMAKGDIAYDAEAAAGHAENLAALTDYDFPRLFIEGTSTEDRPGETDALPTIWENPGGFVDAYQTLQTRAEAVAEVAGDGQEALAGAVAELGQACGNCHDDFRADD